MAYERDNNGVMFQNDRKQKPNHPDYKGQATINGVEYWVSGWIKPPTGKATQDFLSLSFERKDAKQTTTSAAPRTLSRPAPLKDPAGPGNLPLANPTGMKDDVDDDIPF